MRGLILVMKTALPLFVLWFFLSGCSSLLREIKEPEGNNEQAWSDAVAVNFVDANRTLVQMIRIEQRYNMNAWVALAPQFKELLSEDLFTETNKHLSEGKRRFPSPIILLESGAVPWREKLKSLGLKDGKYGYRLTIRENNSPESYSEPHTVYFYIVRVDDRKLKVVEINQ